MKVAKIIDPDAFRSRPGISFPNECCKQREGCVCAPRSDDAIAKSREILTLISAAKPTPPKHTARLYAVRLPPQIDGFDWAIFDHEAKALATGLSGRPRRFQSEVAARTYAQFGDPDAFSAIARSSLFDRITPEVIDAAAQRLVSFEDGSVWPDSWDKLQVATARQLAERAIRSALAVMEGPA